MLPVESRFVQDKNLDMFNRVMLLCAGLLLAAVCGVGAQTRGSIRGLVQHQGQGIAEHRIMLIRFGPGQDVNRTPGQTDADGRFRFEGLETGAEFSYVVGIRYAEKLYRSAAIVLKPGQIQEDVRVEVDAPGSSAAETDTASTDETRVHITHHIMAVVWRGDHLEIREIVSLRHPGATPYEGAAGQAGQGAYVLHLPLPEGYVNLSEVQGWEAAHIRTDAFGLYYTAPLAPGSHRVIYSYALPMLDKVTMVLARRRLPTMVFDIFVDATQLVATSDLQFYGRVPLESHSFLHFRGTKVAADSRSWLQLTRLTTRATSVLKIGGYSMIISIALLGMLIPLYGIWRRRTTLAPEETVTPEELGQWRADRTRLLQTIARLDNAREAGALDEPVYRQQRQAYKQQLLRTVEQLHHVQHHPSERLLTTQKGLG